jgi:hypothetical protein
LNILLREESSYEVQTRFLPGCFSSEKPPEEESLEISFSECLLNIVFLAEKHILKSRRKRKGKR